MRTRAEKGISRSVGSVGLRPEASRTPLFFLDFVTTPPPWFFRDGRGDGRLVGRRPMAPSKGGPIAYGSRSARTRRALASTDAVIFERIGAGPQRTSCSAATARTSSGRVRARPLTVSSTNPGRI